MKVLLTIGSFTIALVMLHFIVGLTVPVVIGASVGSLLFSSLFN